MSQLEMAPNTSGAWWSQNILGACALASATSPNRSSLGSFPGRAGHRNNPLIGTESDESGEALMYAAIYLRSLLTSPDVVPSDEEFDEWSSRVQVMLIMESLQRRGYVHVVYEDPVTDPLFATPSHK